MEIKETSNVFPSHGFCKPMLSHSLRSRVWWFLAEQLLKPAGVEMGRDTSSRVGALVVLGEKASRCNRKIGFISDAVESS